MTINIYKVWFDTITCIVLAESAEHAFILLQQKDARFFKNVKGRYCYRWREGVISYVDIVAVPMQCGVIQYTF